MDVHNAKRGVRARIHFGRSQCPTAKGRQNVGKGPIRTPQIHSRTRLQRRRRVRRRGHRYQRLWSSGCAPVFGMEQPPWDDPCLQPDDKPAWNAQDLPPEAEYQAPPEPRIVVAPNVPPLTHHEKIQHCETEVARKRRDHDTFRRNYDKLFRAYVAQHPNCSKE
jgi:hypothetical protein